jgi:2-oxoglutarate dehydrogenase E2 component (dihydrolipoamide succinyltransferase)
MSFSVTMPQLGESVTEGTVTRWLKKEGDQVQEDEPLLEVSTDKVDTEIPSPKSGVLSKITVAEDETVEVGAELAVIDDDGSGGGAATEEQTDDAAPAGAEAPAQAEAKPESEPEPEQEQEREQQPESAAESEPEPEPESESEPEPAPQRAAEPAPARQPAAAAQPQVPTQPSAPAQPAPSAPSGQQAAANGEAAGGDTYVTPLVRKLASEHNVDLSSLTGTGVGGRIRKQDVIAAAEAAKQAAAPVPSPGSQAATTAVPSTAAAASALRGRTEKMSRLRGVLASRMVESLQTAAQLTTVVEVDVTRVARLRETAKADFESREGVKLSFLPFFAIATAEALKQHPVVNASIDTAAGTITYHDAEHLGIAVDTERGLLVPVIRDAGDLNLGGLARKIADLAARTRANQVNPDELSGGTFTITNTGSRGALFDTPILLPPQVGILGTGAVVKRPVVIDDPDLGETIAIRSMVYLAMTYDHRLVDGADAARFLATVKARLEEGRFEADLGL